VIVGTFELAERICATAEWELYRARSTVDAAAVLLKLFDRETASAADELCIRGEYARFEMLQAAEIPRPIVLLEDSAYLATVFEPFAGDSLDAVLSRGERMPLPLALAIARGLARALLAMHSAGMLHRDLRPQHVLVDASRGEIRLLDLSRAASRDGEGFAVDGPPADRDWAHGAPEQTGRMNRPVDYRADFYSLGIIAHRLLTGQFPFTAGDPAEWVHCHLARTPPAVSTLVPEIPWPVSEIVLKLLAKAPEDRYQNAGALRADLERCLSQWRSSGRIEPFTVGAGDVPDHLLLPHRLYGREQELATLRAAFEDMAARGTPALITVCGCSGVGKSALIAGLQATIAAARGYFVAGKFQQHRRDVPYATLAQAFDGLVRQIVGESNAGIERWRSAIREALDPDASLMVGLIPQLEIVIGAQPPVPELPPQDAQRRFRQVLRRFVGVFARAEHPLVLFLDDLQWLDAGTPALLVDLATHPDMRYLLLVGAYRDNEVGADHPLMSSLTSIRDAGGTVLRIPLAPLSLDFVAQLVAESLHRSHADVQPLAQLVAAKSGGNPFFARQFLTALADEKLVNLDVAQNAWRWNLLRIHAKGYTDSVVDLLVGKLDRLPQRTRDALEQLACLGNGADADTLGIVLGLPPQAIQPLLQAAVRIGLVLRDGEAYAFVHDRVQEAAYSLIPVGSRAATHRRIGGALLAALDPEALEERIFDVVGQLNRASLLAESRDERERLAALNLRAGLRAKAASAHASALGYLAAGAALLPDDCWERCHELSFELELHRAECEFLTGPLASAEARLVALSARALDAVELAAVACLRADLYTTLDQSSRAIGIGLECLQRLGIEWSPQPTEADVRREYERIGAQLGTRRIEDLIELPLMTDPVALATLDVLTRIGPPAYFIEPNLYALAVCRAVSLSLERGNSGGSSDAYARLGLIAAHQFEDYDAAFRFGAVGRALVERGLDRSRARTYMLFGAHVLPYRQHVRDGRELLRRAFEIANRDGDASFAGYICFNLVENLLAAGDPLADVQQEAERGLEFAQQMRFGFVADILRADLGLVRTLRGSTCALGSFDDEHFDEQTIEAHFAANPDLATAEARYWVRKLQAQFHAGAHEAAVRAAEQAMRRPSVTQLLFIAAEYQTYTALARAACCDGAEPRERQRHLDAIAVHHRQLEAWAVHCPQNFGCRASLVGAERARIEGRELEAERLYEAAIESARGGGFVHHKAVALELAANFHQARGFERIAQATLREACACYARWGADAKVRQLESLHPQWRAPPARPPAALGAGKAQLDMLSLVKASQAISGRLVLDELADSLLRIVLENAGAQLAVLLLVHGEQFEKAAEARVQGADVQVRIGRAPAGTDPGLPAAVLNYVRRSRDRLVLPEAAAPNPFSADPYLAHRPPKSLLCLPILRQPSLIGLLYVENHLVTHAFPEERLPVLELLAAQAAISLENARLYADLQRENQDRQRAEQTLREQQSRTRRLIDSNIIGVFFWDAHGGISDANEAFLCMTGYTRGDLDSGRLGWRGLTPQGYEAADARAVEELRLSGTCAPYEKEYIRKDGTRFPTLLGGALLEGSREQGVAFVLDLSERRQAEADREARRAAEAANQAKSRFLANMSHELRTPLNGILGFAQILLHKDTLANGDRQAVQVIKRSGEHLLHLINDILDYAKFEAGRLELTPSDVDLRELLAATADLVREQAQRKRLLFACEIEADLPGAVQVDARRLSQILLNLLSNAVKFTDHGKVTLGLRSTAPHRYLFEVRDTGVGIAPDERSTVFEPFVQVGEVRRRAGGTGLGLAISRQLVEHMGGQIELTGGPGEGSRFSFELELAPSAAAAGTASSPHAAIGYAGPRRRILIVDDVVDNRAVLVAALAALGFETDEAVSGPECLARTAQSRPDLILLDLMMPGMGGLETLRLLREQPPLRSLPIIMVSASASSLDAQNSLEAGADAFVPKPVDLDRLLTHVGTLLDIAWRYAPSRSRRARS